MTEYYDENDKSIIVCDCCGEKLATSGWGEWLENEEGFEHLYRDYECLDC